MFWLIYVTVNIQYVLLWLECKHGEVYTPLVAVIVNNALFHSNSHINQILPQSFLSCAFVWQTRLPKFCNQLMDWDQACSTATNLEVRRSITMIIELLEL